MHLNRSGRCAQRAHTQDAMIKQREGCRKGRFHGGEYGRVELEGRGRQVGGEHALQHGQSPKKKSNHICLLTS